MASKPSLVVALGGGAPAQTEVRRLIRSTGATVRLTCEQRALWKRLAGDKDKRPLLKAASRERLAAIIRSRKATYPKGDIRVSTTRLGVRAVAMKIARKLKARSGRSQ